MQEVVFLEIRAFFVFSMVIALFYRVSRFSFNSHEVPGLREAAGYQNA
jgi:hypothetical protein